MYPGIVQILDLGAASLMLNSSDEVHLCANFLETLQPGRAESF